MTDTIVLTAFVYVFGRDREHARGVLQHGDFLEIYCRCPPEVCETRDPKGRYARARAGEIKEFTGVAAPYEKRVDPELILDSAVLPVEDSVRRVCALLDERAVISRRRADPRRFRAGRECGRRASSGIFTTLDRGRCRRSPPASFPLPESSIANTTWISPARAMSRLNEPADLPEVRRLAVIDGAGFASLLDRLGRNSGDVHFAAGD